MEKQTANHHNTMSRGPADESLTLPQRKGTRQRNKPPVNQQSKNSTTKQDRRWTTEVILESEDNIQT
jgi:hypothetical protein